MYVSFRSKNDIRKLSTMVAGSLFEKSESPSKRKVVEEDFQRILFHNILELCELCKTKLDI